MLAVINLLTFSPRASELPWGPRLSGFCNDLSSSSSYEILPVVSICAVCIVCVSLLCEQETQIGVEENCKRRPVGVELSPGSVCVHKTSVNKVGPHSLNVNNEQVKVKKGPRPDRHGQSIKEQREVPLCTICLNMHLSGRHVGSSKRSKHSKHSKHSECTNTPTLLFISLRLKLWLWN